MTRLTDQEVAAVVALEADAAWPPWTKPAESTSRVGYCLSAEGKFGRVHIAVENRYDAAFICAMRNMWPRLLSDREVDAARIKALEAERDALRAERDKANAGWRAAQNIVRMQDKAAACMLRGAEEHGRKSALVELDGERTTNEMLTDENARLHAALDEALHWAASQFWTPRDAIARIRAIAAGKA